MLLCQAYEYVKLKAVAHAALSRSPPAESSATVRMRIHLRQERNASGKILQVMRHSANASLRGLTNSICANWLPAYKCITIRRLVRHLCKVLLRHQTMLVTCCRLSVGIKSGLAAVQPESPLPSLGQTGAYQFRC